MSQPNSPNAITMVMRATHVASASCGACVSAVHRTTASITHDIAARNDTSPAPACSAAARTRIERRYRRRASFSCCGVCVMRLSSGHYETCECVDHDVDRHFHRQLALRRWIVVNVRVGEAVADIGFVIIEPVSYTHLT